MERNEEMEAMLPCPFCGYADTRVDIKKNTFGSHATVACEICGASVSGIGVMVPEDAPGDDLIASAIAAWNKRNSPRAD